MLDEVEELELVLIHYVILGACSFLMRSGCVMEVIHGDLSGRIKMRTKTVVVLPSARMRL